MGNSIKSREVNREVLPVAMPLMIPVVDSKPLNNSRVAPSAPPFDMQFTPSAPPLDMQPPFDMQFSRPEFQHNKSAYFKGLKDAIFSSRKALARDMINSDKLTMDELYKCLDEIDKYMLLTPKNKTRPIIRKMIVDKLNEMNDKTETSDLQNMLNVIDEEIERNPEDKTKLAIRLILLERINKKKLNLS